MELQTAEQMATIVIAGITTIGSISGLIIWAKKSLIRDLKLEFSHIDVKFAEIDNRFDRIDVKFAEIDNRFDRIETKIDYIADSVEALIEKVEYVEEDTIDLDRRVIVLETIHQEQKSPQPAPTPPQQFIVRRQRTGRRMRQKNSS